MKLKLTVLILVFSFSSSFGTTINLKNYNFGDLEDQLINCFTDDDDDPADIDGGSGSSDDSHDCAWWHIFCHGGYVINTVWV